MNLNVKVKILPVIYSPEGEQSLKEPECSFNNGDRVNRIKR